MDTKLEYLFFDKHVKSQYYELHKHPCYELVYYISGKGYTNIDGIKHPFRSNTFSLMSINSMHNRVYSEETEFLAIGFLFNLPIDLKSGVYEDNTGRIGSYLREMKHEFLCKQNHYQLRLNSLIIEIVIEMDRMINGCKKSSDIDSFSYIKNYMDVHYSEKINLQSLADLSFYSYDHFRHRFKEYTGYSPSNYLLMRRIESAKEMLIRSGKSMSVIGMECGFSTSAQFCHLFKKYVSRTPAQFRRDYSGDIPQLSVER